MCRVHIHQKAYTPTRYGGISTVHNATDNAHMDKAAQTISRTTQNSAHTAMDYALKTQEMNSRLLQQTSQAWIDGFRYQVKLSQGMAQVFFGQWGNAASQQRLAQETTRDLARVSTDNYMDLLDSVFSFYQGGASRTQRRADEARGHIEEAETRAEQAETRAEQAEARARSEAESQTEEAKRRATEAEKRASEAESRAEEAEKRAEQAQEQSQETKRRLQEAERRAEEVQGESQETRRSLQEAQRRTLEAERRAEEAERSRSEAESRGGDEEGDTEADAASQLQSPAGDRRSGGGTPELGTGAPGEEGRVEFTSDDDEDAESGSPSPS